MKTTKPVGEYSCRFPGCELPFGRSQDRGRHESMVHKMKGGAVPNWVKAQAARDEKKTARQAAAAQEAGAPPKKGEPQPVATTAVESPSSTGTSGTPTPKTEFVHPRSHLERAIEQLNFRESELDMELDRLDRLRLEADEIARQKSILQDALEALVKVSPPGERVPPVTLANHGSHGHSVVHSSEASG